MAEGSAPHFRIPAITLDTHHILIALAAFLIGGLVKGTVGLGLPTISLAILSATMDLRTAIGLMAVPAAAANIYQCMQGGSFWELLRRHWSLLASAAVGVVFGTMILFSVDSNLLCGVLGVVLVFYAALGMVTVPITVPRRWEKVLGPLTGISTGIVTGATGSLALPLMIYIDGLHFDKERFVQFTGMVATAITVPLMIGVTGRQMFVGGMLPVAAAALVPSFAGLWVGQRLRRRLPQALFRRLVLVALLAIGVKLIDKGFF